MAQDKPKVSVGSMLSLRKFRQNYARILFEKMKIMVSRQKEDATERSCNEKIHDERRHNEISRDKRSHDRKGIKKFEQ